MSKIQLTHKPHWGFMLKRGLIELSEADFITISQEMLKK